MLEGIGETMKICFRDKFSPVGVSRSGSALLIVLGFLSFMIISGVSFAIYMRIERQASSNYKHAVTARHLLNAALYRAMDEIDSELRIKNDKDVLSNPDVPSYVLETGPDQIKFPKQKDWLGRVKVSARDDVEFNKQDAHVLSLESLSFLPAFLINDVRRYAYAIVEGDPKDIDPQDQNKSATYRGAKWRDLKRATDNELIGRYAYACVNVSDMLNVNFCRAMLSSNANSQACSIGHLFANDSERGDFDDDADEDAYYFSLQDFYAARYGRTADPKRSPYHEYMGGTAKGQLIVFDKADNLQHVYGTDSIFKPDPTNGLACNIYLNQPIEEGGLMQIKQPSLAQLAFKKKGTEKVFWNALAKTTVPDMNIVYETLMAAMVADYLDPDSVPKQLGMPSAEMVPMINRITLNKALLKPAVYQGPDSADTPPRKQYGIRLIDPLNVNNTPLVDVQLALPFKYFEKRLSLKPYTIKPVQKYFTIRAHMCFDLVKKNVNTTDTSLQKKTGSSFRLEFAMKQPSTINMDTWMQQKDSTTTDDDYYVRNNLRFELQTLTPPQNELLLLQEWLDADGNTKQEVVSGSGFAVSDEIRVACTILILVIDGDSQVVDQVPCKIYNIPPVTAINPNDGSVPTAALEDWKANIPKLYFATEAIPIANMAKKAALADKTLNYGVTPSVSGVLPGEPNGYASLEIPDPRFNHSANNWVAREVAWPSGATLIGDKNPSTVELINDNTGRDADIFMSVSDAGYMQSPGELGFILRPHEGYSKQMTSGIQNNMYSLASVNYFAQQSAAAMSANPQITDKEAMFRTFRLYDYGTLVKDDINGHFYRMKEDGTVPGTRINPLTDIDEVLDAAIWDAPLEYWFCATNTPAAYKVGQTFNRRPGLFAPGDLANQTTVDPKPNEPTWTKFRNAWADALEKAVTQEWDVNGRKVKVNSQWRSSLSDVYGDWDVFKWYSANDRKEIFGINNLDNELHEVDRKMLYAHSLDAFSDRQQLFLYFLRAEVTGPSFGGSSQGGMRSLAGGRAVALVWRDPYPYGYDKEADIAVNKGIAGYADKQWLKKTGAPPTRWYPGNGEFLSPWVQYYANVSVPPEITDDPRRKNADEYRWDGYHETRILFFKQLDQ